MKNKNLSIFFAVDNTYSPFLSVALDSIMDNADKSYNYDIYVLTTEISQYNQEKIKRGKKDNFSITFVDMRKQVEFLSKKLFTRDYYSKTTYYRLFIPNMFKEIDKALYLDCDIIVPGDISKLYNIDLGDNLVGAIVDSAVQNTPVFKEYVKECVGVDEDKYFNAGILVMNLKEMRNYSFEEKFISLLEKYKFTVAQDQDYLNAICKDRVKFIPFEWNTMPIPNNICKSDNAHLIHYNMLWKPWQFDEIEYEDTFWKYAKQNAFIEEILKIKESWTKERQLESLSSGDALLQLAKAECENPNNYKRMFLN